MSAAEILKEIDNKADKYMKEVRNYPPAKRSDYIASIQKLFSKSKEYGDDKVQLAMQTYEMVMYIHAYRHTHTHTHTYMHLPTDTLLITVVNLFVLTSDAN